MYLQMHLFGVMFHSGPVRLGEEWGGPPEIKIIFTGINPTSVLEICAFTGYGHAQAFYYQILETDDTKTMGHPCLYTLINRCIVSTE